MEISLGRTSKQAHAERARIVLLCGEGKSNYRVANDLGLYKEMVSRWRERWRSSASVLAEAETHAAGSDYKKRILEILDDAPRSGCPGKFTAEQICQILSVACESPEESEHPLSHWSLTSLVNAVIERGVVESISKSQMHVFLKSGGYQTAQGKDVDPYPGDR